MPRGRKAGLPVPGIGGHEPAEGGRGKPAHRLLDRLTHILAQRSLIPSRSPRDHTPSRGLLRPFRQYPAIPWMVPIPGPVLPNPRTGRPVHVRARGRVPWPGAHGRVGAPVIS